MQICLMISLKLKAIFYKTYFKILRLVMLVMKWQYVYVKFFNENLLKTSVRKVIRDIKGYK